jgi:hypothetical protein
MIHGDSSSGVKPVTVSLGRDRLATKPWPTGSAAFANTMGTARVVCRNALTSGLPLQRWRLG